MTSLPDEQITAHEQAVVDLATRWVNEEVAPQAEGWERERRFAREAFDSAAASGLTALIVPEADGGRAIGSVALARILEEIAAVDIAVAFSLVVHNNLTGAVSRAPAGPLRHEVLPQLVSGSKLGAFLLTEPGVGSDAAAITTRAVQDGDEWVLNGAKAWVTNGSQADILSVYAQTDPELGHRGIAAFLVDADSPGVIRQDAYELFGAHAMGTTGFEFLDCRVPADRLFVPIGQGFAAAMEGIDLARVLVGAMSCGMLRTGLETATDAVKERQAFGGRIADLQGVRFKLADVATNLEAARMLTFRAARTLQDAEPAAVAAAHAKKFATRVTEDGLAECMQVMGAKGARRDHPLPRHLAGARLTHYLDGATEIQDVVISRSLLD
ncbi:MAG: acyl-CoA dehydrogenase family protein [Actinomycetota bacterium]|nr:acyl-CoA dehydrogenase family protein [Actinomycetota bacterium]